MKKLMLLAAIYCLQPAVYSAPHSRVEAGHITPKTASERALSHFKTHYEYANQATWFNLGAGEMLCIFHKGSVSNRVYYDKHGYWRYTLMSYPGSDLPQAIKEQVKDYFSCYEISYVNEIRSYISDPVYIVNIENNDSIKILRVVGDTVEVQQVLEKK